MFDLESAREILDFSKRIGEGQRADEQLKGAVAIHNLLDRHGVAYLADEVGMGKTYVALGAFALFRHLNPGFRILVIAPRENIQNKWMKEFRNFIRHNYLLNDLRVKGLDEHPARRLVSCNSLLDLVHETELDPNRDFFARLTSFSLAVGGKDKVNPDDVRRMRDRLRKYLPWVHDEVFDLRNKRAFKDNFASALCCALPVFDLVIVDEAHNLKHGFSLSASARNRVLALAFGRDPSEVDIKLFPHYASRAKRVLLLSATPVEETYRHLWNQLDIFGRTHEFEGLRRDDVSEGEKQRIAREILVRRLTTIRVGSEQLTKNLYRREWRAGGVLVHDEPIKVTDPRERLTVALVQKKVSELLGHERFNASFQIGMLASFESFLETAKVKQIDEEENTFDDSEQTDDAAEREGIDVSDVNRLADSYRRRFNAEMPHPKMDALVNALANSWKTGEKTLVFVRRLASVKELKRKLDERYDEWLLARLRAELPKAVLQRFEGLVERYHGEKRYALQRELDLEWEQEAETDRGGADTFFAWFFRGEGPPKIVSGANIQQRFTQRGTAYATFFDDNYVAWVLGCNPGDVEIRLASELGLEREALRQDLRTRSVRFLPRVKKLARADRFESVQAASIEALKDKPGPFQALARIVWAQCFESAPIVPRASDAPEIGDWLELRTFFTEIRQHSALRAAIWPESTNKDPTEAFREQELRRQLLAATTRLGHGLIDLYAMTIRRLGSMELGMQETVDSESANAELGRIEEYLALLEGQMAQSKVERGWGAFDELADVSKNFELILDVNIPAARDKPLADFGKLLGRLLRQQQPVGGMAGQVNQTLVHQFRMPGYPLVLITTDLLQEGEDLHTFCSAVHHYGISWTPSAMEQRIGRIDRVRSQTDRRLSALEKSPSPEQKLQVYFPHLQDTVEFLQVRRVLERMDVFLRLMHEGLTLPGKEERRIDTSKEFERSYRPSTADSQPLKSPFEVRDEHLVGEGSDVTAVMTEARRLAERFQGLRVVPIPGIPVEWKSASPPGSLMGTARLNTRVQPFTLLLDLYGTWPRIRCISPVGRVHPDARADEVILSAWRLGVRIGAIQTVEKGTYDLTVEEDVLLSADTQHDATRLQTLLRRVVDQADRLEQEFLPGLDQSLGGFREQLEEEMVDGR
jgi:superfamily II DNA or RNA helicase